MTDTVQPATRTNRPHTRIGVLSAVETAEEFPDWDEIWAASWAISETIDRVTRREREAWMEERDG